MEMYSAWVEVEKRSDKLTDDTIDQVMDQLAQFHVAAASSPRGWAAAQISLPGESLAQACATAAAVVASAYGARAIACEVLTEAEFNIREGWETMPDLVSVSEAAELLGVSRQRVLQRIQEKTLPATRVGRDYVIARTAVVSPES